MDNFIILNQSKVDINDAPAFEEVLVNISNILSVEKDVIHGSCVYLKVETEFHPMYCRENFEDIIKLLKEKGVDISRP